MPILRNKVILLGNATVGKTSLVRQFHSQDELNTQYAPTLHCDIGVKSVHIPDSETTVDLYVHDLGGNEVFMEYLEKFAKNANSFMIVYDVSNKESFQNIVKWINVIKHIKTLDKRVLVANKTDLVQRVIGQKQGAELAQQHGLTYFETSALKKQDVEAPFYYLAGNFYEKYQDHLTSVTKLTQELP
ncbi:small GTPase superfamily [Gorgonomyces haynaldii]|nr:small GTPase superfamily [Gorgonomyces haynaldii]